MRSFLLLCTCLLTSAVVASSAGLAGKYSGTYSGSASGDIHLALSQDDSAAWKADVTFTISNNDVKTKVTSIKVDGTKLMIVYEFDLQGTALESTITGELDGEALKGQYHTKAVADGSAVDEGDWKATPDK